MTTRAVSMGRTGRRLRAARGRDARSSRLTFGLSVVSERAIHALAAYERSWPSGSRDPALVALVRSNHLYGIGRFAVAAEAWSERATLVDAGIVTLLHRLERSGVSASELGRPDVHVRAHFTLPGGAETIRAETVERLGAIGATIWLDQYA